MVSDNIIADSRMDGHRNALLKSPSQDRGALPTVLDPDGALDQAVLAHGLEQIGARRSERMAWLSANEGFQRRESWQVGSILRDETADGSTITLALNAASEQS